MQLVMSQFTDFCDTSLSCYQIFLNLSVKVGGKRDIFK